MSKPKYIQIKDELKKQIMSGQFENGDRFYSESEIIKMYHVSSITVIRALRELVQEGFIVRYQGKGTFVSRSRKRKRVEFSDIELFPLNLEQSLVLSITRGNDPYFLKKLGLSLDNYYYKIERLRTANQIPYIYQQSFLPEQYVNSNYPDIQHYRSIYKRFKIDYNIHMNEEDFVETNEIIFPTPPPITQYLSLSELEPTVMQIKTTKSTTTGQILEYVESYKKWDFFKIELSSTNYDSSTNQ